MVRVTSPETGQRALIRGKTSEVLDLQFAHIKSEIILASIEMSALHVHKIETINANIICTLLLKIEDLDNVYVPRFDKINWCPFLPESETETETAAGKYLVWTRGNTFHVYDVAAIVESLGVSMTCYFILGKPWKMVDLFWMVIELLRIMNCDRKLNWHGKI